LEGSFINIASNLVFFKNNFRPILIVNGADDLDIDGNKENKVFNNEQKVTANKLQSEKTVERHLTNEINNNSFYLQNLSDNNDKNSNLTNGLLVDVKTTILEFAEQINERKIVETNENLNSFRSEFANSVNRSIEGVKSDDNALKSTAISKLNRKFEESLDFCELTNLVEKSKIVDKKFVEKTENFKMEEKNFLNSEINLNLPEMIESEEHLNKIEKPYKTLDTGKHFENNEKHYENNEIAFETVENFDVFNKNIENYSNSNQISTKQTKSEETLLLESQDSNEETIEEFECNIEVKEDKIEALDQHLEKHSESIKQLAENIEKFDKNIEKLSCIEKMVTTEIETFQKNEEIEIETIQMPENITNVNTVEIQKKTETKSDKKIQADNERIILGNESTPEHDLTKINCENRHDDAVKITQPNENVDKSIENAENGESFKSIVYCGILERFREGLK
jgi:hypothetical protein